MAVPSDFNELTNAVGSDVIVLEDVSATDVGHITLTNFVGALDDLAFTFTSTVDFSSATVSGLTSSDVGLGNVPNEDATNPTNWDYGLSGADTTVVTGTAGTSGNLAQWNADGDAVDSGLSTSNANNANTTKSDVGLGNVPNEDATDPYNLDQRGASDGQVLTWDNGNSRWQPESVTGGITWVSQTSAYTASDREGVLADTSGGAFTVTLPGSPSLGTQVYFADEARNWGTDSLTVDGNGNNILGSSTFTADVDDWPFSLVYNGTQWVFGSRV